MAWFGLPFARGRSLAVVCASFTLVAACGGPMMMPTEDGGAVRPTNCSNPCVCADRGPPDYRYETTGAPAATASADQRAALVRTNRWRTAAGLAPVDGNSQVDDAATQHAQFMASNQQSCWPGAHNQSNAAGCMGFTGRDPGARITAAGYTWSTYGEVIDWASTPESAVDEWLWTVYHRQPFMRFEYVHIGYGRVRGPFNGREAFHNVMNFASPRGGATPTRPAAFVVFPVPGQTDVPPGFRGDLEGPTPPAPGTLGVWPRGLSSGTVVSAHFNDSNYEVAEHELYRSSPSNNQCEPVEHTFISRANDMNLRNGKDVFLYANQQLPAQTEFVVRLRGVVNGANFERTWAFTTR
jgi:uncharacterized protein YkwD